MVRVLNLYLKACCRWGVFVIIGCIALIASCRDERSDQNKSDLSAITNRPQTLPPQTIVLIKLSKPPLLRQAYRLNGNLHMDDGLRYEIGLEQTALIGKLYELSPNIIVLHRYRFVLNALSVVVPTAILPEIAKIPGVMVAIKNLPFARPESYKSFSILAADDLSQRNGVRFIGAYDIHAKLQLANAQGELVPVLGQGMKVGIIDSGIDYTHSMFGGSGNAADFQQINPQVVIPGSFPTEKVIGGVDLVGSDYDATSLDVNKQIPQQDGNPIDEEGHGTHVAGTVAGVGDGLHTFTGVAPGASLYAIKVFGKRGSTSDSVVIAALEFAVDPNGDGHWEDHLDVVNLSLGSSFGVPHLLYDEAISNLVRAGITPVMSAGNSGNYPYIVGSPATSEEAISVAASIDDRDANWKFRAVSFSLRGNPRLLVKAVEGAITIPLAEAGVGGGDLIPIGLADQDLPPALQEALKGQVALIDRGGISFVEKIRRAVQAGAIGIVMVNNEPGEPFPMGGDEVFPVPGIMISQELGAAIKAEIQEGLAVSIRFDEEGEFEEPELIDSLTSFSSRGPRSLDNGIKPEIAAPGQRIISAQMGSGALGLELNGTSMAAPHIAGVVALLKQYRPQLREEEIKALLMGTAKTMIDPKAKAPYSVAYQGAGRVQAFSALTSPILLSSPGLSLGEQAVESHKLLVKTVILKNSSNQPISLRGKLSQANGLAVEFNPQELSIAAGGEQEVTLRFTLASSAASDGIGAADELSASVLFEDAEGQQAAKLVALAVVKPLSRLSAKDLHVYASSPQDAMGALTEVTLVNKGKSVGLALPFNLLAKDERKPGIGPAKRQSDICDLESVGYRMLTKVLDGRDVAILQLAAKLYSPITTWNHCEISVQIDADNDGLAEQELLGTDASSLSSQFSRNSFASLLTDATIMRKIRHEYELAGDDEATADYAPAFIDSQGLRVYHHSTLMVLEARLDQLQKTALGQIRLKVASLVATNSIGEADDFLAKQAERWTIIDPSLEMSAFYQLPEEVQLEAGGSKKLAFTKGGGEGALAIYFPYNRASMLVVDSGKQSQILKAKYVY